MNTVTIGVTYMDEGHIGHGTKKATPKVLTGWAGAKIGATGGGMIGSAFPVVGAGVGAVVGGIGGGLAGGRRMMDYYVDTLEKQLRERWEYFKQRQNGCFSN